MTLAPDLAAELATMPSDRLERALVRRFARATVGGLGTPVVTEHPVEAAAVAVSLVRPGGWDDDGGGTGECLPGEGNAMVLDAEHAREDQRQRDINFLRAEAHRDDNPVLPARVLHAVADMLSAAPLNDMAPAVEW